MGEVVSAKRGSAGRHGGGHKVRQRGANASQRRAAERAKQARIARLRTMAHICHATGCKVAVPPRMFMCQAHWLSLPEPLRHAIWRTYRRGQEVRKDPSPEYLEAARAAIKYLEAES